MQWYPEGVVGESFHQDAVRRCRPGMPATIVHQPANLDDRKALAVFVGDAQVGHISRASWIQRAWHDEGKRFVAMVQDTPRQRGVTGIVLSVAIIDPTAAPAPTAVKLPQRGWLARLFGR